MKLAALYTVFNGTELLTKSIEQIYNDVDVVILCYQKTSNRGEIIAEEDKQIILKLASIFDKIFLVEYKPDLSISAKENERLKHDKMIQTAKVHACTHFFMAACDHYYLPEQFRYAKNIAKKYDVTATAMYTYYKNPTWQLCPIEDYFMPFICKLHPNTEITEQLYNFPTDPSVCINTRNKQYVFDVDEIMLHHYSMIRTDIENKFKNAAASVNWSDKIPDFISEYKNAKVGSTISYFRGREIIEVPNYFNL